MAKHNGFGSFQIVLDLLVLGVVVGASIPVWVRLRGAGLGWPLAVTGLVAFWLAVLAVLLLVAVAGKTLLSPSARLYDVFCLVVQGAAGLCLLAGLSFAAWDLVLSPVVRWLTG